VVVAVVGARRPEQCGAGRGHIRLENRAERDRDSMEDRLIRVEEKLTYQEELLQELNEVVFDLSREVKRLRKELGQVREDLTPVDPDRTPEEEVPPHYGPPTDMIRHLRHRMLQDRNEESP
jgi:SlyX protein